MHSTAECPAERMDWVATLLSPQARPPRDIERMLIRILMDDPDNIVRHEAAFVLGKLYQRGEIPGDEAVRVLCNVAVHDLSTVVRHEATESLSWFRQPIARATVLSLMRDPNPDVAATALIAQRRQRRERGE